MRSRRRRRKNLYDLSIICALSLLVGVLLYGAVDSYTNDVGFEAESMAYGSFATREVDARASGGEVLKFTASGTASRQITTPEDASVIVVRAMGVTQGGISPLVRVLLDGRVVFQRHIATSTLSDHAAEISVPAGTHTIDVRAEGVTATRNLIVDVVKVPAVYPDTHGDSESNGLKDCLGARYVGDKDADGKPDVCDPVDNGYGFSPDNTPEQNRAALEGLSSSAKEVILPPGDYRLYNTERATRITVTDFNGSLTMHDGARFVFANQAAGIRFEGGTEAQFYGLTSAFENRPTARQGSQDVFEFKATVNTLISDANIDGSAAAGLIFGQSHHPVVKNTTISNTMGDGLHFANCQDARAENITTENTGDDGLAFLNYASSDDLTGGYAKDITVIDSHARGISVVGQRNVEVTDFLVDGTSGAGLYVAQENNSSWITRAPSDIRFYDGEVKRAGSLQKNDGTWGANRYSIFYNGVQATQFENIVSYCPNSGHIGGRYVGSEANFRNVTEIDTC